MLRPEKTALHTAFLQDHRQLTRGLVRLGQALRDGDVVEAARLAAELDRRVGPHMEFEETVFYPELRSKLGSEFVERLYHEHDIGCSAIVALIGLSAAGSLTETERQELIERVDAALEHAKSCGTLLSHLSHLSGEERAGLLEELLAARRRGRRWTELRARSAEADN